LPNSNVTVQGYSPVIPHGIQFGDVCNAGDGSGRFQPATGVTVDSGGIRQQELTVSLNPAGGSEPYAFTKWHIPVAGYYEISTANLMYGVEFDITDWSGSGDFTSQPNTGIQFYGKIVVQCKTVGEQDWVRREHMADGEGQELTGYLDCNGASSYAIWDTLEDTTYTGYFNAGDSVRLIMDFRNQIKINNPALNYNGSGANDGTATLDYKWSMWGTALNQWSSSNGRVSLQMVNEQIPVYGGEYNLQDVLPSDQKQIDFIKGVAHCFNLQFNTEESSKTVYIEPYSDFYLPPRDAIDWTWKLARNMSDHQSFIDSGFQRKLIFKYKSDDKDLRVKERGAVYFDDIHDNYPYWTDLSAAYPAGEKVFENPFFAGTYDSQYAGNYIGEFNNIYENFYCATMLEDWWGTSNRGYEFLPRILRYNKMTMPSDHNPLWQGWCAEFWPPNDLWRFSHKAMQVSDVTAYGIGTFDTYGTFSNSFYTSATFINRHDWTNQFGLSYGNYWAKDYDSSTNEYTSAGLPNQVGRGLYQRYWQPMIGGLLAKPKLRVCYMDLKITDIIELDFRKMIYIDGVYYRLIRVVDYQPHLNVPTKVELHQWSPSEGTGLPTEGVWIDNTGSGGVFNGGSNDPVPDDPTQHG
jgi:hypothetical protein